MTPELEPGLFGKAVDWVVSAIGVLLASVWGFLKADIRRIEDAHAKSLSHIETLYKRAEEDRAKTRDMIDHAKEQMTQTMSVHHRDVMSAIADMTRRCGK